MLGDRGIALAFGAGLSARVFSFIVMCFSNCCIVAPGVSDAPRLGRLQSVPPCAGPALASKPRNGAKDGIDMADGAPVRPCFVVARAVR